MTEATKEQVIAEILYPDNPIKKVILVQHIAHAKSVWKGYWQFWNV